MLKENNVFQCYDENLRKRLFEVFNYDGDNLFLCAPWWMFVPFMGGETSFMFMKCPIFRNFLKKHLDKKTLWRNSVLFILWCV